MRRSRPPAPRFLAKTSRPREMSIPASRATPSQDLGRPARRTLDEQRQEVAEVAIWLLGALLGLGTEGSYPLGQKHARLPISSAWPVPGLRPQPARATPSTSALSAYRCPR